MTNLELNYLKSEAGKQAYLEHCLDADSRLELLVLKNQVTNPFFGALASLIKLRRAAKNKFTKSEEMFFTALSLEQATSERIAKYIAKRFKSEWIVEDLTCGLGGNAIFLAEQVKKVIAVDLSEEKIACAKENAAAYGVTDKMEFITGDAFLNIKKVDAFFIDPARDREGDTKTRSFLNSSPSLLEILPQLFAITHNVAVKLSPAFDYEELKQLPEEPEIEIISEDNSCKVAMLWFGEFKTTNRRATGFKKEEFFSFTDEPNKIANFSELKKYLYEPNKAISKAHLIDEVVFRFDLSKIDSKLSFLTSDKLVCENDKNIFRKFEVMQFDKFSLKQFQNFVKKNKIERAEIIVKHFKMTADEVRKRLKIKEGGDNIIILTTLKNQEKVFILAKKVD